MGLQGKTKRDTNTIGDISESEIITRLLHLGYVVLIPYGGGQRCDLMVEHDQGLFWHIQCKTARMSKNSTMLTFRTSIKNVTGRRRYARNYRGQCDYFAVYCKELDKIYLIPVADVGTISANLHLAPTKNSQQKGVRWAKDYEL